MVTTQVLNEYRKARREHVSPCYGLTANQPRAKYCLEYAKRKVWVRNNWTDADEKGIAYSNDGNWRLRIVPDEVCSYEDLAGDMFDVEAHASTVPGGRRTIEAQRKEWESKLERDGVWGYMLEQRIGACPACGHGERWDHVDSCYGFDGEIYEEALIEAQYQAKGD